MCEVFEHSCFVWLSLGQTWCPRGPFSTVSPRSGTDGVPIPVSASAFSSRRRGTPRIRVYTRRGPTGPARKNWSAFYNGTWFTWFVETITATCTASIENVSLRCHGDTASRSKKNFPQKFSRNYHNFDEKRYHYLEAATKEEYDFKV